MALNFERATCLAGFALFSDLKLLHTLNHCIDLDGLGRISGLADDIPLHVLVREEWRKSFLATSQAVASALGRLVIFRWIWHAVSFEVKPLHNVFRSHFQQLFLGKLMPLLMLSTTQMWQEAPRGR